jgi:hypothetical protein
MYKHKNLKELFSEIANAIRSKNGPAYEIVADDFPDEIRNIRTANTDNEDALLDGSLKDYTNDRVTSIRRSAFYGIPSIVSVEFPEVKFVSYSAFLDCASLEKVVLPKVENVRDESFAGCTKLNKIVCPRLRAIGDGAFACCDSLKKIDIGYPNDVYSAIGPEAFYNSATFDTLIIRSSDTVIELSSVNAFGGTRIEVGDGYIYVPASMVDAYKAAENWSTFANQMRAIEDYPEICGT